MNISEAIQCDPRLAHRLAKLPPPMAGRMYLARPVMLSTEDVLLTPGATALVG